MDEKKLMCKFAFAPLADCFIEGIANISKVNTLCKEAILGFFFGRLVGRSVGSCDFGTLTYVKLLELRKKC
jgi:hypothetical protein